MERTRHGKVAFYVRIGNGHRTRIRGDYGSAEFMAAYHAAIAGEAPQPFGKGSGALMAGRGSLSRLIDLYKASSGWLRLSEATQSQRSNIYKRACGKTAGEMPCASVTQKHIKDVLNSMHATPFAANDFLKAMRGLFVWAVKNEYVAVDPTEGVAGYPHKTEGFHVWTEEEIARFASRWPIGSRERLALSILLFTGLRRGDAAGLGRQHVRDCAIILRTAKTGQLVTIPLLPELAQAIAATKTGDLAFVATPSGAPMTKESFGNWFREACKAAGVPGSAHGLRKAGATRFANAGFTEAELEAWFGWRGGKMASYYTKEADRVRLAKQAIWKLGSEPV